MVDLAGSSIPKARYTVTASYTSDRLSTSVSLRGLSATKYSNQYIECSSGCPVSTVDRPTIDFNDIPGASYVDATFSYKLMQGAGSNLEAYMNVQNVFDRSPPTLYGLPGSVAYLLMQTDVTKFDSLGRRFAIGIHAKM